MEDFSPLDKAACVAAYKKGFFEKVAGMFGGEADSALGGLAEILMWLPPAAVTAGALTGATTALATAPFEAQTITQDRELARMKELMAKAQDARIARSRQRSLRQQMPPTRGY